MKNALLILFSILIIILTGLLIYAFFFRVPAVPTLQTVETMIPVQTQTPPTPSLTTPPAQPTPTPVPAPMLDGSFLPDTPQFDADGNIITSDSLATLVPSLSPSPAPTMIPSATPAIPSSPPATEAPAAAPQKVYATKSPTSERILMGGSAEFVANAENSTGVTWFIASPDCSICVTAAEAPRLFPALWVKGCNSNRLTIGNVPCNMNGWQVQARFDGYGGPVHTNMATIYCATLDQAIAQGWYYQTPSGTYAPTPFYPGY